MWVGRAPRLDCFYWHGSATQHQGQGVWTSRSTEALADDPPPPTGRVGTRGCAPEGSRSSASSLKSAASPRTHQFWSQLSWTTSQCEQAIKMQIGAACSEIKCPWNTKTENGRKQKSLRVFLDLHRFSFCNLLPFHSLRWNVELKGLLSDCWVCEWLVWTNSCISFVIRREVLAKSQQQHWLSVFFG